MGDKLVHRLIANELGNPVQDPELVTIDSPAEETNLLWCGRGVAKNPITGVGATTPKTVRTFGDRFCDVPGSQRKKLFVGPKAESKKINWVST
jgi:hypothetical protein